MAATPEPSEPSHPSIPTNDRHGIPPRLNQSQVSGPHPWHGSYGHKEILLWAARLQTVCTAVDFMQKMC